MDSFAEPARRLDNVIRLGTISKVDYDAARCGVKYSRPLNLALGQRCMPRRKAEEVEEVVAVYWNIKTKRKERLYFVFLSLTPVSGMSATSE